MIAKLENLGTPSVVDWSFQQDTLQPDGGPST
jgi:hypothetical protein